MKKTFQTSHRNFKIYTICRKRFLFEKFAPKRQPLFFADGDSAVREEQPAFRLRGDRLPPHSEDGLLNVRLAVRADSDLVRF